MCRFWVIRPHWWWILFLKRLESHFWNEPLSGSPGVFPGNPSNEFSDCANMAASGFWYWLGKPPGCAPSFMLRNSDCRFTRGYQIGHPCRDFRDPCACNAGSSLPGLYHIMGTSGTLAPANVRLDLSGAQVNQLRQGLHYEVLNVVVLRWSGTLAPVWWMQ